MLVNPISYRLSVSIFWKTTWSLYKYNNYKYLFHWDLIFFEYLSFFLKKIHLSKKDSDFYISHIRFYRMKKKIVINFYYYFPKGYWMYKQLNNVILNKKKNKKKVKNARFNPHFWEKKGNSRFFFEELRGIQKLRIVPTFNVKTKKNGKKNIMIRDKTIIQKIINKIKKSKKRNIILNKDFLFFKKTKLGIIKHWKEEHIEKQVSFFKVFFFEYRNSLWALEKSIRDKQEKKQKKEEKKYIKKEFNSGKNLFLFTKIKKNFKNNINYKKIMKIKNYVLGEKKKSKIFKHNFPFLVKLYLKKFIFSCKLFFYNLYIYIWSKMLKVEIRKNFLKNFGNLKINGFHINIHNINARVIVRYLQSTLQNRYNVWYGLRRVIADLNKRVLMQNLSGYKILFCGRFKRALRATYIWRKNGHFFIGSPTTGIDHEVAFHKSKYGVGAIKIWLIAGNKSFKYFQKMYPVYKAFFFLNKKKFFYLKKNDIFFNLILKHFNINYSFFNFKYIKNAIVTILYTYLYTNIFLKKLKLRSNKKLTKINENFKKILIPQYFIYKICNAPFWQVKYLKIKPYINYDFLKRINIRNSYKLNIINKYKRNLKKRIDLPRLIYRIKILKI